MLTVITLLLYLFVCLALGAARVLLTFHAEGARITQIVTYWHMLVCNVPAFCLILLILLALGGL